MTKIAQDVKPEPRFNRLLRLPEVKVRTGLSRSGIYERINNGGFPKPVQIGEGRSVGWVEQEIEEFISACVKRRAI